MIALLALAATALAGDYYHPSTVSAASEQFRQAAQASQEPMMALQERLEAQAQALQDAQLALDLLGDRAPAGQLERLADLRKQHGRQRAMANAFLQELAGDFDAAFGAALQRALAGATPEICVPRPSIPGPRARAAADCEGTDLGPQLAAAMDSDPQLSSAVQALTARPWPSVGLEPSPVQAVGPEGAPAVDVASWFRLQAGPALDRIAKADDQARLPFEAAIEEGASADELQAYVADARAITRATAEARAALAAPVLSAADKLIAKGKLPAVAWCAQPALLGGCASPTADPGALQALSESKTLQKALAK